MAMRISAGGSVPNRQSTIVHAQIGDAPHADSWSCPAFATREKQVRGLVAGLALALAGILFLPSRAWGGEFDSCVRYSALDLGLLPTRSLDNKPGLGEFSEASLWKMIGNSKIHAQLVSPTGSTDLGELPGYPNTFAADMNSRTTVVGTAQAAEDLRNTQAFVWESGEMRRLPTLGGLHAVARAINRAGRIGGAAQTSSGAMQAVRWADDKALGLGTLDGGNFSQAYAINDHDEIVGDSNASKDGKSHPFLWSEGSMRDLGTLPGGTLGSARAINNSHQVVGYTDQRENEIHAVLWSPGARPIDLGSLGKQPSTALDINDAGQIVGTSAVSKGPMQAFLWEKHGIFNLNRLVAEDSGWLLATAYRINEQGEILGRGFIKGESHAFLLQPLDGTAFSECDRIARGTELPLEQSRSTGSGAIPMAR